MSLLQTKERPDINREKEAAAELVYIKGNIPQFLQAVLQSQDRPLKRRCHGYHETCWDVLLCESSAD